MGNENSSQHRARAQNRTPQNTQFGDQYPHYQNRQSPPNYNFNPSQNRPENLTRNPNIFNNFPQNQKSFPYQVQNQYMNPLDNSSNSMQPSAELNIVNLDKKFVNSAPPLIVDVNSKPQPNQNQNYDRNPQNRQTPLPRNQNLSNQKLTPEEYQNWQKLGGPNQNASRMNENNIPSYNNVQPNFPLNQQYSRNPNIGNRVSNENKGNFKFNQIYENQEPNQKPNDSPLQTKNDNYKINIYNPNSNNNLNYDNYSQNDNTHKNDNQMPDFNLNPDYYRQEYNHKRGQSNNPNQGNQQKMLKIKKLINNDPKSDLSIEKYLNNYSQKQNKAIDPRDTSIDFNLQRKETNTKIKELDLLDKKRHELNSDYNNVFINENQKNAKKINKDYNNVFLNNENMGTLNKMQEGEFPIAIPPKKIKPILYQNEGFEKLDEITNFFLKKKYISISKDENSIEDFSHFFIFPGTSDYNQLNLNPLFYVIYNEDYKSKYCCFSNCRNVYARVLHAKGIYKGHEFLEICEDDSNCCSDQICIIYNEDGHKFRIGTIEIQRTCCGESFTIINDRDEIIYIISQTFSNSCKLSYKLNCEDCQNVDFEILSDSGQNLSKIKKIRNTCCFFSEINQYDELSLDFPANSSKMGKTLLLAAVIYLQKKFFEG